jgi:serine/threonine protein kinase
MAPAASDLSEREERFGEIAFAFLRAAEEGGRPDPNEWLARYPEFGDELAGFLNDLQAVDRLAGPLRKIVQAASAEAAPTGGPDATVRQGGTGGTETPAGVVGDYELLGEIARGGMGVVYRARQKSLNRLLALKMVRAPDPLDAQQVRRFRNEAETVAGLDHPHIVPVYEVGEHAGQLYFSMKLIEGGTAAEGLHRFAADPRAAARLLAQVARAVHHAHQRGVLHRDLKPSNILLDAEGRPHVTDFGLARRVGIDSDLTQSGAIIGTPSYMAPEQTTGQRGAVTTATDVYGLGAVLYALLTGRPPFQGPTVLDTLEQVRTQEPQPPGKNHPQVDRDLETICLKCLEKDPARRYGSADQLADDLERWLRNEPIEARPIPSASRLWRWCRRNPRMAWLSATALVALLLTLGVLGTSTWIISRKMAETQVALARADAKNRWARRAVNDMYSQVAQQWLAHQPHMTEVQKRFLRQALGFYEELAAEASDDPDEELERAIAYRRMADIRGGGFHRAPGAEKNYRQAVAICEELTAKVPDNGPYQEQLGRSYSALGEFLSGQQRYAEAKTYLLRALAVSRKAARTSPGAPATRETIADYQDDLGVLWENTDDLRKAERAFLQTLQMRRQLAQQFPKVARYREKLAFVHFDLGLLLRKMGRLRETEQFHRQAVALFEKRRKDSAAAPWFVSTVGGGGYHGLAEVLLDTRRPQEARQAIQQSVAIRKEVDRDFPGMPYCWHGLAMTLATQGRILTELGRHQEAAAAYQEALAYQGKAVADNPGHPGLGQDLAWIHGRLAWLGTLGPPSVRDVDGAIRHIRKALEREPEKGTYLTVRALTHYRRREWTSALAVLRKAVQSNDRSDRPLRGWVSAAGALERMAERQARTALVLDWFFMAMCQHHLHQADHAKHSYRRALRQWQAQTIDEPAHVAELQAANSEAAALLGVAPPK